MIKVVDVALSVKKNLHKIPLPIKKKLFTWVVAVEERGLPSVGVWIDEKVGRQGQRLEIGVDYTDGKLFSTVDTQGQHSWDIMVPKKYSPWEMESDWRKKHKTPLEEAKKWRGLMDTVSKLRPIDRAVMSR